MNEQKDSASASLCLIAAGLIAIAGSLLIGGHYRGGEELGSLTLLVAGGVLIMGLVRWFKR